MCDAVGGRVRRLKFFPEITLPGTAADRERGAAPKPGNEATANGTAPTGTQRPVRSGARHGPVRATAEAIGRIVQELPTDRPPIRCRRPAPRPMRTAASHRIARNGAAAEAMAAQVQWLPTDRPAIGVAERDRKRPADAERPRRLSPERRNFAEFRKLELNSPFLILPLPSGWYFFGRSLYPARNRRGTGVRERKRSHSLAATLVGGLTGIRSNWLSIGDQEIHPSSDAGRAVLAARAGAHWALLFNKAALRRNYSSGLPRVVTSCIGVPSEGLLVQDRRAPRETAWHCVVPH